jgi:catechol-2,3-dioxygenase
MIKIREIDHIVLRVADEGSMVNFYCNVLGCTVERHVHEIGLIQLRAGRSLIDLVHKADCEDAVVPDKTAWNMDHFCVRIDPFDEAEIRQHLEKRGVPVGVTAFRYGAEGSGPSLYLTDPEGNVVELKGPPIG